MKYIKSSTKKKVEQLLKEKPHLRDDDNKLLATVWFQGLRHVDEPVMDFLYLLAGGFLPSSESVRRCRQHLQVLKPELRGKLWDKRHGMEKKIKKELREMEND